MVGLEEEVGVMRIRRIDNEDFNVDLKRSTLKWSEEALMQVSASQSVSC